MPRNLNAERDNPCLKVCLFIKTNQCLLKNVLKKTGTGAIVQMPQQKQLWSRQVRSLFCKL